MLHPARYTLAALTLLAAGPSHAAMPPGESYPVRPIRIVVPFPPGGNVDTFARMLFRHVEEDLGQPMVIDNRGGANGILGADTVAKATPDGYTLLATSFGFAVNRFIVKKLPFDHIRDFQPVTNIALGTGYLMVGHPQFPARTVKDLIVLARQQPGKIRYSTAGIGNGQHLAGALFCLKAGIDMLHVPYKGGGPALNAVMAGETQIHFPSGSVGVPQVKSKRVTGIAFTGARRLSSLPDMPTIGEILPGFVADAGWHGMFAPARTPIAIVTRIQQAVHKALQIPKVHDYFVSNGYDPKGEPPAVWAKYYADDLRRLGEIVKAAKIEPQ
ncbi:MAG: tripartite tricarboxylate transporter substrate binding protein [Burkholderiales bacterium]|nr:tripartite tricarboxylate transporter substrate binding protein [Burkholderiales bacterium]